MATHRINKGRVYKVGTERPYWGKFGFFSINLWCVQCTLHSKKANRERILKYAFKQSLNALMYNLNFNSHLPTVINKRRKNMFLWIIWTLAKHFGLFACIRISKQLYITITKKDNLVFLSQFLNYLIVYLNLEELFLY